jgi:hypothetical protein
LAVMPEMKDMMPGQEKRMVPVLMEDEESKGRRWWKLLKR